MANNMKITLYLILTMIVIFLLEELPGFVQNFSLIPSKLTHKPWMIFTSIFLHANFAHLFYNMLALFFFGTYLESIVSKKTYLKIFFISGIFGNILYILTTPNPNIPALGASGAVYGVIGALASLRPYAIVYIFFIPTPLIVAAIFWTIGSMIGMLFPSSIAHAAHLGGILIGFIYGEMIKRRYTRRKVIFRFEYF